MSVSASIDIKLVKYIAINDRDDIPSKCEYNIPAIEIIKELVRFGWTPNINGEMHYLPIGDKDDYAWISNEFNFEKLNEIVEKKESLGEIIGINMQWKDTDIQVSFIFYPKCRLAEVQLSVWLDASRPILFELSDWHKVTDVNWFLIRLLPAFKDSDLAIESFSYNEYK